MLDVVKNTVVGEGLVASLPGLVHSTTSGKVVGRLEGMIEKTVPAPKVKDNTMPSGKAPATRVTKTHFGSVQYPGAHS